MSLTSLEKIDTHQHLLYPDRFGYSWTDDFPALQGAFPLETYWQAAEGCQIRGTLFMEVDVDEEQSGDEARLLCSWAEDPEQRILGVIAAGRPESQDFPSYVDRIQHDKLKGIRRVLHTQPDALIHNSQLKENLDWLGSQQLSFDLCVLQRQLPLALDLVDACPHTQIVLDHCGVPEMTPERRPDWEYHLRQLAERPHVSCKISGLVAYLSEQPLSAGALRPWIETALDAFGWDRVVWGADWPVCTLGSSIRDWCRYLDEILAEEHPDHLAKLYSANAERIYTL